MKVYGTSGDDELFGSLLADEMYGGSGHDTYRVNSTEDKVIEGRAHGIDTVSSYVSYTLPDNVERLFLTGDASINGTGNWMDNWIIGNDQPNTLKGMGGNDYLDGQGGADSMIGGTGDDTYFVDFIADTVIESENGGFDIIDTTATYVMPPHVEQMFLREGSGTLACFGNDQSNLIRGNSSDNGIWGKDGNDSLYGLGGKDGINGGAGVDYMEGGANEDTFRFAPGFGLDTIGDFQTGYIAPLKPGLPAGLGEHDVLQLHTAVFADFAAVQTAMQQVGNNTVITYDADNTITLLNVVASDLQAGNFSFMNFV